MPKRNLEDIVMLKVVKEKNSELYNNFLNVYRVVEPLLNNRISQVFPYYTMHNVDHSLRIMEYMEKLIPDLDKINEFEVILLCYAALLHDIGMAASEEEINSIKDHSLSYGEIDYEAVLKKFNGEHIEATQEYIRKVHAIRSAEFIRKELKGYLYMPSMPNTTFEDQLSIICQSHTEDIGWINKNLKMKSQKAEYEFNPRFCSLVLRLADILDFDSQRTPPSLLKSVSPEGISKDEWEQHFSIENVNKIKNGDYGFKLIELHGRCDNPSIHRKILSYIDWINNELENAVDVSQTFPRHYKLLIHSRVHNYIDSEGYTIADMKFKINYNEITKLLMGDNLYGDKKYGLRELIQNSIDACKLKKEILDSKLEFGDEEFKPSISIILDEDRNQVIIKDNGIGMNFFVLKNYFLKLGSSFYSSDDYSLRGYKYKPIGNYGIGFLACFMLSDEVKVKTRHMNDSVLYQVDLNKYDEFVCINENEEHLDQGTEVILNYGSFMKVWEKSENVIKFLQENFITDEINLIYVNKKERIKKEIFNSLNLAEDKNLIDLSEYLNEVTGYISILNDARKIFAHGIEDISFVGEPYIYQGEKLISLDDTVGKSILEGFLDEDKLYLINIPLIEHEYELEEILNVLEDTDDAIDKYIEKYDPNFITIIVDKENYNHALEGYINGSDEFLEGLNLWDLSTYDIKTAGVNIIKKDIKVVYKLKESNLCLELYDRRVNRLYIRKLYEEDLYVRDIYVKDIELNISNMIKNITIKKIKINLLSTSIVPNVTRTNLHEKDLKEIENAVYIAICLYIYESLTDEIQRLIVKNYFIKYHNKENRYVKGNFSLFQPL